MKELVSVIIPACNEEKGIENTLKSAKNQTYKNLELIVVDNNSDDKTGTIALKYTNSVFPLFEMGASKARDYGAKNASGSLLAFLDADTVMSENLIEKCVDDFTKGSRVIIPKIIPDKKNIKSNTTYRIINFVAKNICPSYTPFISIDKKLFNELNGFNESIEMREEIDLLFRARKKAEIKYEDKAFVVTSVRRFEKEGYLNIIAKGAIGYFYAGQKWPAVR